MNAKQKRRTRRRLGCLVGAMLFAVACGQTAEARHMYVATNATPGGDYDSWANAFTNLQDAFEYVQEGDTLYLAGHVFEGTALGATHPSNSVFLLQDATNITIRGGYQALTGGGADPGANDPAQWPTVLTRVSGIARILTLTTVTNVLLEGIMITDGYRVEGAGVHVSDSADVRFYNVRIVDNQVTLQNGAGVFLDSSAHAVRFEDCLIAGNRSTASTTYGGGIYSAAGTVTITNTLIHGNSLVGGTYHHTCGAGVYLHSGSILVMRSIIRGNEADSTQYGYSSQGGAFYVAAAAMLDIRDSVIVSNTTKRGTSVHLTYNRGGGIYNAGTLALRNVLLASNVVATSVGDGIAVFGGGASIINCTITDNAKIGVYHGSGTLAVTNSIIWGHAVADMTNIPVNVDGRFDNFSHSLYGAAYTDDVFVDMHGIADCIVGDPLFANDGEHPYRLRRAISPAIDAGINLPWMHGATDVAGYSRIMYGGRSVTVDMGAYETFPVPGSMIRVR